MNKRYKAGDIVKDNLGYCTIIEYKKGSYHVYECDDNGIPTRPAKYRFVNHKNIIELIHG